MCLVFAKDWPPALLMMRMKLIVHLLDRPMLIYHAVGGDIYTGAVHVYFARGIARLIFRIVDNGSELIKLFISRYFKYTGCDLNPLHAKLFAQLALLRLRVCSARDYCVNALIVKTLNFTHLRIRTTPQVWGDLLRVAMQKRCIEKSKLHKKVLKAHD